MRFINTVIIFFIFGFLLPPLMAQNAPSLQPDATAEIIYTGMSEEELRTANAQKKLAEKEKEALLRQEKMRQQERKQKALAAKKKEQARIRAQEREKQRLEAMEKARKKRIKELKRKQKVRSRH